MNKRKQNEIDIFGYTIINLGKRFGIATPVIERLVGEIELTVKSLEQGKIIH
jgi:hypothetical protein